MPDAETTTERDAEIRREQQRHRSRVEQQRQTYEENAEVYDDDVLLQLAVGGELVERDAAKAERVRRLSAKLDEAQASADEQGLTPEQSAKLSAAIEEKFGDELPPLDIDDPDEGDLPSTDLVPVGRVAKLVDVATGEQLDVTTAKPHDIAVLIVGLLIGCDPEVATPEDVADAFDRFDEVRDELGQAQRAMESTVVAALDRKGKRKTIIGGIEWETNAPTTEVYDLATLRSELSKLVEAGKLDQSVVEEVIVTPPPKEQEPRVAKREVNNLKRSDDPAILTAIATARRTTPARRTLKLIGRVPVAELVEEVAE